MLHLRKDYQDIQDTTGSTSIGEREKVFIVRTKDRAAANTVRAWAAYARNEGADPEMCARAQEWADEMEKDRLELHGGGKAPDVPAGMLLASNRVQIPFPKYCQHCGELLVLPHADDCPVLALESVTR